jgi:hypothetical protein
MIGRGRSATTTLLGALAVFFILSSAAIAGVRVEFVNSITQAPAGQPASHARWTRTLEIDGPRFRIVSPNGVVETSFDDGVTTFFGSDRTKPQTPFVAHPKLQFGPVGLSIEDEELTVGMQQPGAPVSGVATRTYTVDYRYVEVVRMVGITRSRAPMTEHYEFSVGDIGASAAAVRVVLSRGYGQNLARHTTAFRAFPLRIVAHLIQPNFTVDFRLEAVSVTPWPWPRGE